MLLERGAEVNLPSRFDLPLLAAAAGDSGGHPADYATVVLLLARGARVDATDKLGRTALHNASDWGAIDVAELLLAHGADINRQDQMGLTPVYAAAARDRARLVEFLLEKGAAPNAGGRNGLSPFKILKDVSRESVESLEVLRRRGAKP